MNNKIIYFEINKSHSSIEIIYSYSTRKYLENSGTAWSPYLRLRSAALGAMDDGDDDGDGGERCDTSGSWPSPAMDTRCCVCACI